MSSPEPEPRQRVAALYTAALAALACGDVDAAVRAVHEADAAVAALDRGQPGGLDLEDLHRRLTQSAREMQDRTRHRQVEVAVARRMVQSYAASLAAGQSRLDAEA